MHMAHIRNFKKAEPDDNIFTEINRRTGTIDKDMTVMIKILKTS